MGTLQSSHLSVLCSQCLPLTELLSASATATKRCSIITEVTDEHDQHSTVRGAGGKELMSLCFGQEGHCCRKEQGKDNQNAHGIKS